MTLKLVDYETGKRVSLNVRGKPHSHQRERRWLLES
jgi:hypothetical protein